MSSRRQPWLRGVLTLMVELMMNVKWLSSFYSCSDEQPTRQVLLYHHLRWILKAGSYGRIGVYRTYWTYQCSIFSFLVDLSFAYWALKLLYCIILHSQPPFSASQLSMGLCLQSFSHFPILFVKPQIVEAPSWSYVASSAAPRGRKVWKFSHLNSISNALDSPNPAGPYYPCFTLLQSRLAETRGKDKGTGEIKDAV